MQRIYKSEAWSEHLVMITLSVLQFPKIASLTQSKCFINFAIFPHFDTDKEKMILTWYGGSLMLLQSIGLLIRASVVHNHLIARPILLLLCLIKRRSRCKCGIGGICIISFSLLINLPNRLQL